MLRLLILLAFMFLAPSVASADDNRARDTPAGCNGYGCWKRGGGCNGYGCWERGGGCNGYGCWRNGGGCNGYGCWNSPRGSCNGYGCSEIGECNGYGCPKEERRERRGDRRGDRRAAMSELDAFRAALRVEQPD